jgi:hypothetical protein
VAAREGAKVWLRTLPGLVVCGGLAGGEFTSDVWRLDLGELRWERMPSLTLERADHACCAVRGSVVVLGGMVEEDEDDESETEEEDEFTRRVASVEIFGYDSEVEESMVLPPLSCDPITGPAALPIEEIESELGQVLPIRGWGEDIPPSSAVHKVDLATGVCTPQPPLLSHHGCLHGLSVARLADGRIVCVGRNFGGGLDGTTQVLEPLEQGSPSEASCQWRYLPAMSVARCAGGGCVRRLGRQLFGHKVVRGVDYR